MKYPVEVLLRSGVAYKVGPTEANSPAEAIKSVTALISDGVMLKLTSGATVSIVPLAVEALYCGAWER